jgi:hypothetical protein
MSGKGNATASKYLPDTWITGGQIHDTSAKFYYNIAYVVPKSTVYS